MFVSSQKDCLLEITIVYLQLGDTRASEGITWINFITKCYFVPIPFCLCILCGLVWSTHLSRIELKQMQTMFAEQKSESDKSHS